ncbi:hypothetical protein Tcan_12655 [Toxocara canis]|uniref:Uncharacterized protein n=1 Tax=Toxocara canis TaxID=6265 RepID=A0A0B2VBM0_TOXCA|nr:hypothetical protein Tcan_12655 [Toxocara canis]
MNTFIDRTINGENFAKENLLITEAMIAEIIYCGKLYPDWKTLFLKPVMNYYGKILTQENEMLKQTKYAGPKKYAGPECFSKNKDGIDP